MSPIITKVQLARELGVGKSAVSNYVRRGLPVRPDGKLNRTEALAWIRRHVDPHHTGRGAARAGRAAAAASPAPPPPPARAGSSPGAPPALPPAYGMIAKIGCEFTAAAAYGALRLAYALPARVAALAVGAGAPLRVAYALHAATILSAIQLATEVAELSEEEATFALDGFAEPDWAALAARAGEPVDLAAWRAHLRATFGEEGEDGGERRP